MAMRILYVPSFATVCLSIASFIVAMQFVYYKERIKNIRSVVQKWVILCLIVADCVERICINGGVIRMGLEPITYCLEGSCSIQLSYRTSKLEDPFEWVLDGRPLS